jgi:serine/threonine-protein kinase
MRMVAPEGTEIVEPLPNGSVFQVARVRHGGQLVVCKRLLPRFRQEPAAKAAIVREASALSRARHPAVPELVAVGTDAHGPYVLQGYVEGVSLRALVEAWRERGAEVPPTLVAHLAVAAAEALASVHELGVSHGDLGPDHVLLTPIGAAAFVDFGAARFPGMDPALETGDKGTLPFVAPEVARGEAPPGQAADVYALAATVLYLAAGGAGLVSARDEGAMLLAIGEAGLSADLCDRATSISAAGRDALRRAIALNPAARLTAARELAAALSR